MSGPSLLHQIRCFSHLLSQYLPQDSTTAAQEEGWGPLWEGESGIGHGTHQGREGGENGGSRKDSAAVKLKVALMPTLQSGAPEANERQGSGGTGAGQPLE